ncbi:hydroxymethylpyrimidine/phosphomethylpyrimidine kinase [Tenacibaculum sp. ZS6-P6]|uniref:hydroxymethylpyrimidine/phosphomethylpyrimidine kinase n=1 Tax=Tenacibaculum sp. ZS6-P6 TaxID=3447503 RepID=UPI003F99BA25
MKQRPYILTIAGLDPSNGAGLTADVKTFEQLKCYGLSVCTANTIQNDKEFLKCDWIALDTIIEQIQVLFDRFSIATVKIGIVEDWQKLSKIIDTVLQLNPDAKIVLDPVLKSSTGFVFQNDFSESDFDKILEKIYLITPNYLEIQNLYQEKTIEETIHHIQLKTHLFLKGGHHPEKKGIDYLYTKEGKIHPFNPKEGIKIFGKHGSGCVLSSAIASYIALKYPLVKSCFKGKRYIEKVLSSNKTLLGYHN